MFQAAFRSRKVPFNVHGVAFYRKKVFVPDFLGMGHNLLGKSRLRNLVFPFVLHVGIIVLCAGHKDCDVNPLDYPPRQH